LGWSPQRCEPIQQRAELIQCLLYTSRVGEPLHPLLERVSSFCANTKRGIAILNNADFLVDAMSSISVTSFLQNVAENKDKECKQKLSDLLSGHYADEIQRSFSHRKDILDNLKFLLPPPTAPRAEWDAKKKTEKLELVKDGNGVTCIFHHKGSGWQTVMSLNRLSAPSAPSAPRRTSFEVIGGRFSDNHVSVGVSHELARADEWVGSKGYGIAYRSYGGIYKDGSHWCDRGAPYIAGDLIQVEVDFIAHTVSFFKNGKKQGLSVSIDEQDRNRPLYAAVSLCCEKDQATLL